MSDFIKIIINGQEYDVASGQTALAVCDSVGIKLPRLCYLKDINETANCRLCLVEVKGYSVLKSACSLMVFDQMEIVTNSKKVEKAVIGNLELLAHNHRFECHKCTRVNNCELLHLLKRYSLDDYYEKNKDVYKIKQGTVINKKDDYIIFDSQKCVNCARCLSACVKETGCEVIGYNKLGYDTIISTPNQMSFNESGCLFCGKCLLACPTDALKEKAELAEVEGFLASDNYVIACIAPAVRVALGEEFMMPYGENVEGKIYTALKHLEFDDIAEVSFGADLTIKEESYEFLSRLMGRENLPMFTSCCPGWVNYVEKYFPEYLENLSTTKSPQQMLGSFIKNYYAQQLKIDVNKIKVVSIMPCIAKKEEANRQCNQKRGIKEIDAVITTREFATLIKKAGIDFRNLEDSKPNSQLANYTGAGAIFGATGGVMESALRAVNHLLKNPNTLDFTVLRGNNQDIKEASFIINNQTINVAVVNGIANMPAFIKKMKEGQKQYHFVEVMACSGGCVNGGGQPIITADERANIDIRKVRAKGLYKIDEIVKDKMALDNQTIKQLEQSYFSKLSKEEIHELYHTCFSQNKFYNK